MLMYTCVSCNTELVCEKNDVALIHFLNNDKKQGIDVLRFGDIWRCRNCGYQVVLGLGKQILGMDVNQEEILKRDFVEVKR